MLPYILGGLKQKIETITPVHKIYLFGSRARVPEHQCHTLAGKDPDIVVVCNFPIVNTSIWTTALGYHLDLIITSTQKADLFLKNMRHTLELYPHHLLPALPPG